VFKVSVLVPAYNEERNIRRLLRGLSAQRVECASILEIIVVASGCTDRTREFALEVAREEPRIRLVVQDVRMGKVSAINAFLRERDAHAELTVICGADLLLQPGCLELLLRPFVEDRGVGMAGGRPRPTNPRGTLLGNMVHFVWDLHHERSCEEPKMGELVAFRSELVRTLDESSAVDEAYIESLVKQQGYRLKYVPEAVVANRGPSSLREFFEHRRRIEAGHLWLRAKTGYSVSTMDWKSSARLSLRHFSLTDPATDGAYLLAIGVEALARGLGFLDLRRSYSHAIWKSLSTARSVSPEDDEKVVPLSVRRVYRSDEASDASIPKGSQASGVP
jgi:poly-beta-1,6-N-acetyl-D-glucosamine synthase